MDLGLAAIHHARFGADPGNPRHPEIIGFWAERLAGYGVPVDRDRHLAGNHNPLTGMSLHQVDHHGGAGGLRLVINAHATPDCDPYSSLAGSFAQRYADQALVSAEDALVLAVSDQGRLAPFSALALARAYPRRRPALVVAVDQGTVPFADPGLAGLDPATDHAVGLLLTADGPTALGVPRQLTSVPPRRAGAVLAAQLPALRPDLVVTGPHLPPPEGFAVLPAPAGQLCTAVWSGLAGVLAVPAGRPRRVVVAEYEPALECLGLVAVEVPAARPAPAPPPARGRAGPVLTGPGRNW